jgi:excisionase family DNA binding protein
MPGGRHMADCALLTAREAAEYLRLSRRTLYAHVAEGSVPVLRLSPRSRLLFDPYELRAWLTAHGETRSA